MDAGTRLGWIRLYEQVGNAGLVCRRCGISRPTLRKWWRRFQQHGDKGLSSKSRAHCIHLTEKLIVNKKRSLWTFAARASLVHSVSKRNCYACTIVDCQQRLSGRFSSIITSNL